MLRNRNALSLPLRNIVCESLYPEVSGSACLLLSSAEFMPVGSEREEELQETRCVPQLETRLQHGSEHVRPAQVRTLAGQSSLSLFSELYVKDSNIRRYISSGFCDSFS